jgi:flagellar biosynthesis/type III secretory pathway M-ring protein FliF/YscJ
VSALVAILTLLLLAAVVLAVSAPLRRSRSRARERETITARSALEAAREAKYREIRDAELDYRTGKLSPEDYEALSASLRAEAIQILDQLAALDAAAHDPGHGLAPDRQGPARDARP